MPYSIRPYTPTDSTVILHLLRLNTPAYFAPEEEQDLLEYLQHHAQHYFVVEEEGVIVAGGGYNLGFDGGQTARISWDLVHPRWQGKGIGAKLTRFRIEAIELQPTVSRIVVRTTQLVYLFYQKLGFVLLHTEKDYWAKGFDLYVMELRC